MLDRPNVIDRLVIEDRFRGPPGMANGGYAAGRLAAYINGPASVTLRKPVPLESPIDVCRSDPFSVAAWHDGVLIAEAEQALLRLDVPEPPTDEEAAEAAGGFAGFDHHFFPECFVCGPSRMPGDGLRIFTGRVEGRECDMVAAPWMPEPQMVDADMRVEEVWIWSALDCPGYFAGLAPGEKALLGQLSCEIFARPCVNERCTVIGWPMHRCGRKVFVGTALFGAGQRLLAQASAIWVRIGDPTAG